MIVPTPPNRSARTADEPSRRLTLEEGAALLEDEPGELCQGGGGPLRTENPAISIPLAELFSVLS